MRFCVLFSSKAAPLRVCGAFFHLHFLVLSSITVVTRFTGKQPVLDFKKGFTEFAAWARRNVCVRAVDIGVGLGITGNFFARLVSGPAAAHFWHFPILECAYCLNMAQHSRCGKEEWRKNTETHAHSSMMYESVIWFSMKLSVSLCLAVATNSVFVANIVFIVCVVLRAKHKIDVILMMHTQVQAKCRRN